MTALVEAAAAGALHTAELADHHCTLRDRSPAVELLAACCGTDFRHV
jgi:hypothetical protein